MKPYLRWDGYRVKHVGEASPDAQFVSFGKLCGRNSNSDSDRPVQVMFEPGRGYTYKA